MLDIAIIPREKFSRTVGCLSSLRGVDLAGGKIFLLDVGYPDEVMRDCGGLITELGIEVIHCGKGYLLANDCLNQLKSVGLAPWILLLENDCELMTTGIDIGNAIVAAERDGFSVVQPLILEADAITAHYDPPLSYVVKTEHGLVHQVVRTPRVGFPRVASRRRVFHIEKHALLISRIAIKEQETFEDFLVTRSHWDLSFRLHAAARLIVADPAVKVRFISGDLEEIDRDYFFWRWNRHKAIRSNEYIRSKWSILNYHSSVEWLDSMLMNQSRIHSRTGVLE